VRVELITRKGCHLCDQALELLRSLGVEPEVRDVDADAGLFAEFDFRVPVVRMAGRVVGEGAVRREPLERALARHPPT
jgi:predicted thioredoxin/glutaredoxin